MFNGLLNLFQGSANASAGGVSGASSASAASANSASSSTSTLSSAATHLNQNHGQADTTSASTDPSASTSANASVNPLLGPLMQITAQPQQQQVLLQQAQQVQQVQQPSMPIGLQMHVPPMQLAAIPLQPQQQPIPMLQQFTLQSQAQLPQQPLALTPEQHQRLLLQLAAMQQQQQQQQQQQLQQPQAGGAVTAFTLQPNMLAQHQQQLAQPSTLFAAPAAAAAGPNPLMLAFGSQPPVSVPSGPTPAVMTNPTGGQALQLFSSDVFASSPSAFPITSLSIASSPAPSDPQAASSPLAGVAAGAGHGINDLDSTTSSSTPAPTAVAKRGTGRPRGRPRGSKTGASSRAAASGSSLSSSRSGLRRSASASSLSPAPSYAHAEPAEAAASPRAGGKAPRRPRAAGTTGAAGGGKVPRHPQAAASAPAPAPLLAMDTAAADVTGAPEQVSQAAQGPSAAAGKAPRVRRTNQNMGKTPRAAMVAAHVAAAGGTDNGDGDGQDKDSEREEHQQARPAAVNGRGPRLSTHSGKSGKGLGKHVPPTASAAVPDHEPEPEPKPERAAPAVVDVVPREEQSFKVYFPDLVPTIPLPIAVIDPDNPHMDTYGFGSGGVGKAGKDGGKGPRGKGKGKSKASMQPFAPESTASGQSLLIQPSGPLKPVPAIEFYELPDTDTVANADDAISACHDSAAAPTPFAFPADGSYLSYTPLASQIEYDLDDRDRAWCTTHTPHLPYVTVEHALDTLDKSWHSLTSRLPHGVGVTGGLHVDDGHCCVCGDDECENANAIVFCDGCNIAVHQECYGVVNIPEGQWLCRRCETQSPPNTPCVLCGQPGGALKQATDSRWVHVLCALWIHEAQIVQVQIMEPIDISSIPPERYALVCSVCKQRRGACIQCSKGTCCTAFHVTCARQVGLVMHNATHRVLCERHGSVGGAGAHGAGRKRSLAAGAAGDKRPGSRPSTRGSVAAASASSSSSSGPATQQRKVFRSSAIVDSDEDDEVGKIVHVRTGAPALASVFGPLGLPSSTPAQDAIGALDASTGLVKSRHPFEFDPAHPVVNAFVFGQLKHALPNVSDEDLTRLCKLWAVKRALRGGGPLLRRLVIDQSLGLSAPSSMTGVHDATGAGAGVQPETHVALIVLRHELERIRVMSDQLRKRERLRAQAVGVMVKAWNQVSLALRAKLQPILDAVMAVDTRRIFAEPVDTELVSTYLDTIREPMDFATVQKKLDFGLFGTVAEFRADLQLIWDNCKEFNPPETVYYRAAVACEQEANRLLDAFEEQVKARDKWSVPFIREMDVGLWPFNPKTMERVAEEAASGVKGGRGVLVAYRKRILAETAAGRTRLTRRMLADGSSSGADGMAASQVGGEGMSGESSGPKATKPPKRPRTPSPPPPAPVAYSFDETFMSTYTSPSNFPRSMPIGSIGWVRIDPPGIWWPMRVLGVDRDWLERTTTQWPPETIASGAPHPWIKKLKKDVHTYRFCMPLYYEGTTTHSGMWLRVQRLHAMTPETDEKRLRAIRENKEGHEPALVEAAIAAYEKVMELEPQWERKAVAKPSKKKQKAAALSTDALAPLVASSSSSSSGSKKRRMTADSLVSQEPTQVMDDGERSTRSRRSNSASATTTSSLTGPPPRKRLRIVGLPPPPPEPEPVAVQFEDDGASLTDLSDPDEAAAAQGSSVSPSREASPVRGCRPRIKLNMDSSSPLSTPGTSAPTSARSTSPVPGPDSTAIAGHPSGSPKRSTTPRRSSTPAHVSAPPLRTPSPLLDGSPAGSPTPRAHRVPQSAVRSSSPKHGRSLAKARSPPHARSKSPLRNELAAPDGGPVIDTDDELEQELHHAASSDDLQPPASPHDEPEGYVPRHVRASQLDADPLSPGEVVYIDRSSSGASTPIARPRSRAQRRPPREPVIALPSLSPGKDNETSDTAHAVPLPEPNEMPADLASSSSSDPHKQDEEISAAALKKQLPFASLSRAEQLAIKRTRERQRKLELQKRRTQHASSTRSQSAASGSQSVPMSSSPLSTPAEPPALPLVRKRTRASLSAASSAAVSRAPTPSLKSDAAAPPASRSHKRGRTLSSSSLESITSISSSSSSSPSEPGDTPEQRRQLALARRRERERARRAELKAQRLVKLGLAPSSGPAKPWIVRDKTGKFKKAEKSAEAESGRRDRKRKHRSPSPGGSVNGDADTTQAIQRKSKSRRLESRGQQQVAALPVTPSIMSAAGGAKQSAKQPALNPPSSSRRAERLREAGTAPVKKVTLFEAFNQIEANAATLGLRASRRGAAANSDGPPADSVVETEAPIVGKGKSKAKGTERLPLRRKARSGAGSPVSVSELSDLSE